MKKITLVREVDNPSFRVIGPDGPVGVGGTIEVPADRAHIYQRWGFKVQETPKAAAPAKAKPSKKETEE